MLCGWRPHHTYTTLDMENISYWVFPGIAETKSVIQSTGNHLLPSPQRVFDACCEHFQVTEEQFNSTSRLQKIVNARAFASTIIFHFCGWNFVRLAKLMGKDRTTLMHHVKKVRGQMEMYEDERQWMLAILGKLGLLNEASSGSDWYAAWADEQLKSPDTYMNILHKDTVEALNEMIEITQADGRGSNFRDHLDGGKKTAAMREARKLIPTDMMSRMSTVKDYGTMKMKNHPDLQKYRIAMGNKRGDTNKLDLTKVNKYDKY